MLADLSLAPSCGVLNMAWPFKPDVYMQSADTDAGAVPPSQLGLGHPSVADRVGMLQNPPLPQQLGASGAAVPASPNPGNQPYHVPQLIAIAMHTTTAGPAQHVPHSCLPDHNSAQLMPTAGVGQTPPQWRGPASQRTQLQAIIQLSRVHRKSAWLGVMLHIVQVKEQGPGTVRCTHVP